MPRLCLVTQAYFDANEDEIRSLAAQAGVGNFTPIVAEGGLVRCRGIDPSQLVGADVYELPEPLQEEGVADYRARIAVAAVGAFNAVVNGPREVFFMPDEKGLFHCQAANGWPKQESV